MDEPGAARRELSGPDTRRLGRAFKLTPKLISLLAIGSSICGVSAIIAGQGAIDADAALNHLTPSLPTT